VSSAYALESIPRVRLDYIMQRRAAGVTTGTLFA
jgi:hypothetical protein